MILSENFERSWHNGNIIDRLKSVVAYMHKIFSLFHEELLKKTCTQQIIGTCAHYILITCVSTEYLHNCYNTLALIM